VRGSRIQKTSVRSIDQTWSWTERIKDSGLPDVLICRIKPPEIIGGMKAIGVAGCCGPAFLTSVTTPTMRKLALAGA
jgi:hypothetical protein